MKLHISKSMAVRVVTRLGPFTIYLHRTATGQDVFDRIVNTLELREFWYFGLVCLDKNGINTWVDMSRQITKQKLQTREPITMKLSVKYFPEEATNLVQRTTKRMFYLHLRDNIHAEHLYCPPDVALVLASYAAQEQYGNYDSTIHRQGLLMQSSLIPPAILYQHNTTPFVIENMLTQLYSRRAGLTREEAVEGYLRVVQDLHMHGVRHFPMANAKGTPSFVAVDSFGLKIYSYSDILAPVAAFHLGELRQVAFRQSRLTLTLGDNSTELLIFTPETSIAKRIFLRCLGYWDLYERGLHDDVDRLHYVAEGAAKEIIGSLSQSYRPRSVDLVSEKLAVCEANICHKLKKYDDDLKAAQLDLSRLEREMVSLEQALARQEKLAADTERQRNLTTRAKNFYEFHTSLSEPSIPQLAPSYRHLVTRSMDLSATEARHVAEAERLRALLGDARQQKARIQRQITSVFETRQNLHVFDDGITENDDVVERAYRFAPLKVDLRQVPWAERHSFCEADPITKYETERLVTELETMVIPCRLSSLDEIQRDLYRTGCDKYRVLRDLMSRGIRERIRIFERL